MMAQAHQCTAKEVARIALLEAAVQAAMATVEDVELPTAAAVVDGLVALLDRLLLQGGPQGTPLCQKLALSWKLVKFTSSNT